MALGKMIARIEESPIDPEYGGQDDDTLLIHFTDGTALKIEGHSYEPVSFALGELSSEDVRRRQAAQQGQREQKRIKDLQRQEWLSISCDERVARIEARKAKMGPFALAMRETFSGAYAQMLYDSSRLLYGDQPERRVRQPCKRCHETQCENATVKVIPAEKGFDWKTASFSVQAGSLTDQ